jgi:hypothetical protein
MSLMGLKQENFEYCVQIQNMPEKSFSFQDQPKHCVIRTHYKIIEFKSNG